MFFRLCNSPGMFQAIMNEIFTNMEDICVVYIDDLMIFTKSNSKEEHDKIVLKVLCCLEENHLFIKPEKCTFHAKEVEFLSMIMGKGNIHMDNSKIKAILEWPKLKNMKGVQSFLELANFYCQFISGYAQVAHPLNDLTKKDMPFIWDSTQQQVFNILKENSPWPLYSPTPTTTANSAWSVTPLISPQELCYLFSRMTCGTELPTLPTLWAWKNITTPLLTKKCWASSSLLRCGITTSKKLSRNLKSWMTMWICSDLWSGRTSTIIKHTGCSIYLDSISSDYISQRPPWQNLMPSPREKTIC